MKGIDSIAGYCDTVRVRVVDIAARNCGKDKWVWLLEDEDLLDLETAEEKIREFLPGAEEWEVAETEGLPRKKWGLEEIVRWVNTVVGMDEGEREAFWVYTDDQGEEWNEEHFRDSWRGNWSSWKDYLWEEMEGCYNMRKIPSILLENIDWEGVWNDMAGDGLWGCELSNGDIAIFEPA